jgi:hypothetical protein
VAVIVAPTDDNDLEAIFLQRSPRFRSLLSKSRAAHQYRPGEDTRGILETSKSNQAFRQADFLGKNAPGGVKNRWLSDASSLNLEGKALLFTATVERSPISPSLRNLNNTSLTLLQPSYSYASSTPPPSQVVDGAMRCLYNSS